MSREIRTISGRMVDPFALRPEDIEPEHIAICLARIPRFLGATNRFYSVAEHSIRVARMLSLGAKGQLAGLLHDAHEAYLGDWPRPIRPYILTADGRSWSEVELQAARAIRLAFGLPAELPAETTAWIARIDDSMLAIEKERLTTRASAKAFEALAQAALPCTDWWESLPAMNESEARTLWLALVDALSRA